MVRVLSDQLETAFEIEVPSRGERMVGPQPYPLVAGAARELEAGIDQPATEVVAARVGVDEQDPQQRGAIAVRVGS